tara:strand:- start:130 stop:339 length:210 start_codon:yes stop_codon:yes gene_type:complete
MLVVHKVLVQIWDLAVVALLLLAPLEEDHFHHTEKVVMENQFLGYLVLEFIHYYLVHINRLLELHGEMH